MNDVRICKPAMDFNEENLSRLTTNVLDTTVLDNGWDSMGIGSSELQQRVDSIYATQDTGMTASLTNALKEARTDTDIEGLWRPVGWL